MTYNVSMETFAEICDQRLADAVAMGEATPMEIPTEDGSLAVLTEFQTPAGLAISQCGDLLSVTCSPSDLGLDLGRGVVSIVFGPDRSAPPVVKEIVDNPRGGVFKKVISPAYHETLATPLAKFVTLIPQS